MWEQRWCWSPGQLTPVSSSSHPGSCPLLSTGSGALLWSPPLDFSAPAVLPSAFLSGRGGAGRCAEICQQVETDRSWARASGQVLVSGCILDASKWLCPFPPQCIYRKKKKTMNSPAIDNSFITWQRKKLISVGWDSLYPGSGRSNACLRM